MHYYREIKELELKHKIPEDKLLTYMKIISVVNRKSIVQIIKIMDIVFKRMTEIKKKPDILSDDDIPNLVKDICAYNSHSGYLDYLAEKWESLKAMEKRRICKTIGGDLESDFRTLMDYYNKKCDYNNVCS